MCKRISALILVISLLVLVSALSESATPTDLSPLPPLEFHMIDLGSANGFLLVAGDSVIMVDGGMNKTGDFVRNPDLMEYLSKTIDHIDLHILTHYHNDHVMNFPEINAMYGTEDTVIYGPSDTLPERLPVSHGQYRRLTDGDCFTWRNFEFLVIGPEIKEAKITGEINKDSLNIVIIYNGRKILITGDYVSNSVVQRHPDEIRDLDILVFPHHGLMPYYLSESALYLADPKLILVPGNNAGNIRVLCRNVLVSVPLVYSGSSGDVVVTLTQDSLSVACERTP